MERTRTRSIHEFILDQAAGNPIGLARRVAEAYGISRQAANRHLDLLVETGQLEQSGRTRARAYRLRRTASLAREVRVTPVLNPDRLWEDHIEPILSSDPPGLRNLCRGAFGEVVRNAIEHAGASWIQFSFENNARDIDISVSDDGSGIFHALQAPLGAASPREAAEMITNLANARASHSPAARLALLARHFDAFVIRSAGVVVAFQRDTGRWTLATGESSHDGTSITLRLRRPAAETARRTRSRTSRAIVTR